MLQGNINVCHVPITWLNAPPRQGIKLNGKVSEYQYPAELGIYSYYTSSDYSSIAHKTILNYISHYSSLRGGSIDIYIAMQPVAIVCIMDP